MGSLIGAKLHSFEEGHTPTPDELKEAILLQREFNALVYAVSIDPMGEDGTWAEADVAVAVDDNDIVVAYEVVRISVDDVRTVAFGSLPVGEESDDEPSYEEWTREVAAWAHSQEGMERWYWFHIHPEGMAGPSDNDERKLRVIQQADFLTGGHVGAPRRFQTFGILQRAGINALQSDDINGVSPASDALTARVFANSYDRTLGVSHPLSEAMNDVANAIEAIADKQARANNPMGEMLAMFEGASALAEAQKGLAEARDGVETEELNERLKADYIENGKAWPSAVSRTDLDIERPVLGFRPPTIDANLPQLSAGVLADLDTFNFDSLD